MKWRLWAKWGFYLFIMIKLTGASTTILSPCPKHHLRCRISSWNSGGWKEIFISIGRTEMCHPNWNVSPNQRASVTLSVLQNLPEDSEEVKKKKEKRTIWKIFVTSKIFHELVIWNMILVLLNFSLRKLTLFHYRLPQSEGVGQLIRLKPVLRVSSITLF